MRSSVSIVRCRSYDEEEVLKGLRQSIDLLGGIETFIQKGNRVLLKPNLLFGKPPDQAVNTHPVLVKGMIQMAREAGGIPLIGDSPGFGSAMKAADRAGIKRVAEAMDCPIIEFNQPVPSPKGGGTIFKHLEIDRSVLEADVVINLPKWKTHGQMLLTLGVKNLYGCVPGPRKALWHLKAGEDRKIFAQILVDLYRIIQPSLTILDGIIGMEGNGPASGRPISLGLIVASRDALGLDQVVCDLLGMPRKTLPTNRTAFEQGLGKDEIEVLGEDVKAVKISSFELPPPCPIDWNLPEFLKKALKNAMSSKPVIDEEMCKACNRCVEICPPRAFDRKGEDFVIDDDRCIRCFCCQEICPEGAISIKPGWALRFVNAIGNRQ